jgi:mevalonate kinase
MVTVSAPGKIHLMGEHAVVYGKPALLSAINLRMRVSVEKKDSGETEIYSTEPDNYAWYAFEYVRSKLEIVDAAPVVIRIDSQIPAGYHLGSSAAMAVSMTGALMYFYKRIWNPIRINELAYEIEKKQHGNPSGGDNTAVTMGGFLWYRRELEFLRSMWQLPFRLPAGLNHFFLINTGKPQESTGDMIALVQNNYDADTLEVQRILDINEVQTKKITTAIKEANENNLLDAMKKGEETLEKLGVVSERVQSFIRGIEKTGGSAKILGGGGAADSVGFLLCYSHDPQKIRNLSQSYGWDTVDMTLGEEGVRLDEK